MNSLILLIRMLNITQLYLNSTQDTEHNNKKNSKSTNQHSGINVLQNKQNHAPHFI